MLLTTEGNEYANTVSVELNGEHERNQHTELEEIVCKNRKNVAKATLLLSNRTICKE
uniref:Uncharacterized protein n=1 Tax=Tetranychus urticae TaxID=32264 RepID=T1JXT5_TETUR